MIDGTLSEGPYNVLMFFRSEQHGADRRAGTTETEYRGLLEGAGFRYNRMIPTELPISILEAVAE